MTHILSLSIENERPEGQQTRQIARTIRALLQSIRYARRANRRLVRPSDSHLRDIGLTRYDVTDISTRDRGSADVATQLRIRADLREKNG